MPSIKVLTKDESPEELFDKTNIDKEAMELSTRFLELNMLGWPSFDNNNQKYWEQYSSYYRAVLADTIKKLSYGKNSKCETKRYKPKPTSDLIYYTKKGVVEISNTNMLTRAKEYSASGKHVCGFNPMNQRTILGGGFDGAPNFEEDLGRISELGIALVKHAREDGDFEYRGSRPHYNTDLGSDALLTTSVKVIKSINIPPKNFWYAKQFIDLQENEQFSMSFVGNAAIPLERRRQFTAEERDITETRIRSQLTAMVEGQVEIALLTDFGCGAFNNDPAEIAEIYRKLLIDEGYLGYFEKVEFTIINPGNYKLFEQAFNKRPEPRFFPAEKKKSNVLERAADSTLSEEMFNKLKAQIEILNKEIESSWPYPHKKRKKIKVQALLKIIEDTNKKVAVAELLESLKADKNYPEIIKGKISHRTASLLNELESQFKTPSSTL